MKKNRLIKWVGILIVIAVVLGMVVSLVAYNKKRDDNPEKETASATEPSGETTEATTDGTESSGETTENTEPSGEAATDTTTDVTEPSAETESTAPTTEAEPPAETDPPAPTTEATSPTIIETEPEPEKVYVTMYTTTTMNYRTGPGTDYPKKGSLAKGSAVQVVEGSKTDNGWYEVLIQDECNYMYADYLSLTPPSQESGSADADNNSNSGNTSSSTGPSSNNNTATGSTAGFADTTTGISWDGHSPIVYTYTDGTTGTEPKEGATYECLPGVTTTYKEYTPTKDDHYIDGKFYCPLCNKEQGDGSNGTCLRYLMSGDKCLCCGVYVPADTCHTCAED